MKIGNNKPVDARILLIFDETFIPILDILDEAKPICDNVCIELNRRAFWFKMLGEENENDKKVVLYSLSCEITDMLF